MEWIGLKMCAYANGQLRGSPLTRRRDTLQEVGVAWVVGVVVRLRTALGVGVEFYRRKRREKVRNRAVGAEFLRSRSRGERGGLLVGTRTRVSLTRWR